MSNETPAIRQRIDTICQGIRLQLDGINIRTGELAGVLNDLLDLQVAVGSNIRFGDHENPFKVLSVREYKTEGIIVITAQLPALPATIHREHPEATKATRPKKKS